MKSLQVPIPGGIEVDGTWSLTDNYSDWKARIHKGPLNILLHTLFEPAALAPYTQSEWGRFVGQEVARAAPAAVAVAAAFGA